MPDTQTYSRMKLNVKHYRERETGLPVHDARFSDGQLSRAVVRYVETDDEEPRLTVAIEDDDGDTESFAFEETDKQYVGIDYTEGERRDLPEGVQDLLLHLGMTVVPEIEEVRGVGETIDSDEPSGGVADV